MHAATTHIVRITERHFDFFGDVVLCFSECLRMPLASTPRQVAVVAVPPFIMFEICSLQMGSLLQQHDRVTGGREFFGHDAPGCTGTDDDKINPISSLERSLCHHYSPFSA